MNTEEREKLDRAIDTARCEYTDNALTLGFLRYEKLRQLNPREFEVMWLRCLSGHERFDDAVDALVIEAAKAAAEAHWQERIKSALEEAP